MENDVELRKEEEELEGVEQMLDEKQLVVEEDGSVPWDVATVLVNPNCV